MKVVGLVVEYNPFHNGHFHHIREARRQSGAGGVICVMSGNFIQRGEPAVVNKWARAKMALRCGADLVLELPAVYAMASAEYFALGAVSILDAIGITDAICFGSESGNISELEKIASILSDEPEAYKKLLRLALDRGLSYPSAREKAVIQYLSDTNLHCGDLSKLLSSSNNILGIEYLKALKRLDSRIQPITIPRIGNTYHESELTGSISSATAIRRFILDASQKEQLELPLQSMPPEAIEVLLEEFDAGRGPVFAASFENLILFNLRKAQTKQLSEFNYISEGFENRLKNAAEHAGSLEELLNLCATRRFTNTRIQRSLFNFLAGITSGEFDEFNRYGGPQYARVLGFNSTGQQMLSAMKKKSHLPVVIKTADFKRTCNPLLKRMLDIEALTSDLYVLGYQNPAFKFGGQEFTQNLVRI